MCSCIIDVRVKCRTVKYSEIKENKIILYIWTTVG